jgi:hypothetical protein
MKDTPPRGLSRFWDVAHRCNCNNEMIGTVLVFSNEVANNIKIPSAQPLM